jgi:DNA-binding transcriptional LysR family regulator
MDQLNAMRAFVRVAETASFSAVAHEFSTTQATISKRIAALEALLGVKLLRRSSREQSLTEAGSDYYQRSLAILEAVDEAETIARCQVDTPRGVLRITTAVDFAKSVLSPLLQQFMVRYPDIHLDLMLSNHRSDLIAEGIDIAIRAGQFEDSAMIATHLCTSQQCLVASKDYLRQHGQPDHPNALKQHNCLIYSANNNTTTWSFIDTSETHLPMHVAVSGRFNCDNAEMILDMALAGCGVAILPYWMTHQSLENGTLTRVLPDSWLPKIEVKIIYPDKKHLPLKTRFFIDFITQQAKSLPALRATQ